MTTLIPKLLMYLPAIGLICHAIYQFINEKDPTGAMNSLLAGLTALGFGGALHLNTNATVATAAKADVLTTKTTEIQDAARSIESTTNAINRKV
jgi:hypothetical protein